MITFDIIARVSNSGSTITVVDYWDYPIVLIPKGLGQFSDAQRIELANTICAVLREGGRWSRVCWYSRLAWRELIADIFRKRDTPERQALALLVKQYSGYRAITDEALARAQRILELP